MTMPDDQPIAWQPVVSSNLAAVATDGADLLVRFQNGGEYRLTGAARHAVPLQMAVSPGSYYNRHLRDAYPTEKLA